jgi:DNA-binding NtrC family response regulator
MNNLNDHLDKGDILIVDNEMPSLRVLSEMLIAEGYEVRGAPDGSTALMIAENEPPELILLDIQMPEMDGYEVCRQLKENEKHLNIPVLFLSALDETADKVKGFEAGAVDFITKPFQAEEVLARVETHLTLTRLRQNLERQVEKRTAEIKRLKDKLKQENIYLREEIEINYRHDEIVGESSVIKIALSQAEKVAEQTTCVLIQGETGTGKELLARAIHKMSPRKSRQMITVNCGALPGTLVENEMFGREKGAFTGAITKGLGRFEIADGSTIFLDEIGDLPLEVQSKLLRVIEKGSFERLGSSETITVDVRIIAATNHDLKKLTQEGRFRKDLFYRLNAFPVTLPPLRERRDDIPLLAWSFIRGFAENMGKKVNSVPKRTMSLLQNYPWPGMSENLKM